MDGPEGVDEHAAMGLASAMAATHVRRRNQREVIFICVARGAPACNGGCCVEIARDILPHERFARSRYNRGMYRKHLAPCVLLLASAACSSTSNDPEPVTISFAPLVAGSQFSCSATYTGIGTSKTSFQPLDFRMYVTDVALVRSDGVEVPVTLDADGVWQRGKFALLDFEDASGTCVGGSKETNLTVRGKAPPGTYAGVAFTVGIPEEENHLDAATAPAPLNAPGMSWSWSGGYKYVRIDVQTPKNKGYYLHLGATNCTGSVSKGFTCAAGNRPRVKLDGFDLRQGKVALDLADLWANQDLDAQIDGKTDQVPGCMAFPGDPECPSVFTKLGLNIDGSALPTQSLFKAAAR